MKKLITLLAFTILLTSAIWSQPIIRNEQTDVFNNDLIQADFVTPSLTLNGDFKVSTNAILNQSGVLGLGNQNPHGLLNVSSVSGFTIDQSQGNSSVAGNGTGVWQSFKPSISSFLTRIVLTNYSIIPSKTFKIYEGVGVSGTLVYEQQTGTINNTPTNIDITTDIAIIKDRDYTFQIGGSTALLRQIGNPYARGESSFTGDDLTFETHYGTRSGTALYVGSVGLAIGTDNTSVSLNLNEGNIGNVGDISLDSLTADNGSTITANQDLDLALAKKYKINGVTMLSSGPANTTDNYIIGNGGANLIPAGAFQSQHNLLFGKDAGLNMVTSGYVIAIGNEAVRDTEGSDTVIGIGGQCLKTNVSGRWLYGLGDFAIENNVTGNRITAFGFQVLNNCKVSDGTAMGHNSLFSLTYGERNSAYGAESAQFKVLGEDCVDIGYRAGHKNQNGTANVNIGVQADGSGTNHSSSRGIKIGYQAGMNDFNSDRLYIEPSSSGSPLIYGEFENDTLQINGELTVTNGINVSSGNIIATGTFGAGSTLGVSGAGTRLIWYPKKAAFRAGHVTGTEWDDANIGNYSVAMGRNCIASGDRSIAMGNSSEAFAQYSLAIGSFATATARNAIAFGEATASGRSSTAIGDEVFATGLGSIAFGEDTLAAGTFSVVMGEETIASGDYAVGIGRYIRAQAYNSWVIGRYNEISGSENAWIESEPLFVIANGEGDTTRNNAITVLKDGKMGLGTANPTVELEVSGDIKADDLYLDNMVYGAVGASYNATATPITTQGIYYDVTENAQAYDASQNITVSNGVITVLKSGTYQIQLNASFSGGNITVYHGGISINNATPEGNLEFNRKLGASGDQGSISAGGIRSLSATDTIRFKIENEDNTSDPIFTNWNLYIIKIAP